MKFLVDRCAHPIAVSCGCQMCQRRNASPFSSAFSPLTGRTCPRAQFSQCAVTAFESRTPSRDIKTAKRCWKDCKTRTKARTGGRSHEDWLLKRLRDPERKPGIHTPDRSGSESGRQKVVSQSRLGRF